MPRDVVLHGALLEGTGTQMDKPLGGNGESMQPIHHQETKTRKPE